MFRNISLSYTYLHDYKARKEYRKIYEETQKNISKIKKEALEIKYEDYANAYNYVDNLFPGCNVKDVIIYKLTFLRMSKMGYGEAEGFYDPVSKTVVISSARPFSKRSSKYDIRAKITRDEVIVHELCHYCYVALGHRSISSEMREEFAYGWSIGYLRQKGYTDDQIIKYNFLPYLFSICYSDAMREILVKEGIDIKKFKDFSSYKKRELGRKYESKIFELTKHMSEKKGKEIIALYSKKIEQSNDYLFREEPGKEVSRFDILDL